MTPAARPWPALLSGEIAGAVDRFFRGRALAKAGEVKIIGVTSDARVDAYGDAPTMKEQGIDTTFVNWRGFFAAPGLPEDKLAYQDAIAKMYDTPEWEEVRARNGWVNIHNSGDDFRTFLEGQEKVIGDLMKQARLPLIRTKTRNTPGRRFGRAHRLWGDKNDGARSLDCPVNSADALAYGYAAYFTMDGLLPPFMQRNPVWPSTFPKVLSCSAIIAVAVVILLGLEKAGRGDQGSPISTIANLGEYKLGQALDAAGADGGLRAAACGRLGFWPRPSCSCRSAR